MHLKTPLTKYVIWPLLIASASVSFAASVTDFGAKGDGVTDDTRAFKRAVSSGKTVVIPKQPGACYALNTAIAFGGTTVALVLPANVTLQGEGNPTLCSTNPGVAYLLGASARNIKIDGVTFSGTPAVILSGSSNPNHQISGVTFTNNIIENLTGMSLKIPGFAEWGILVNSNLSNNTFRNIWPGGFPANGANLAVLFPQNNYNGGPCYNSPDGSACDVGTGGMMISGGIANSTISHNKFIQISNDALNINIRPEQLTDRTHIDAPNVLIAWNEFVQVHRMGIEAGGFGPCQNANESCNFALVPLNAPVIKDNYFHNPAMPYWHTFAFSFVFNGTVNATFLNNTATNDNTANCYGNVVGIAFEHAANSLEFQGNVVSSARSACGEHHGWNGYILLGGIDTYTPQGKAVYRNNVTCGQGAGRGFGAEGTSVPMVVQNNFESETCPYGNDTATSNIGLSFLSSDKQALNQNGTWNVGVVSTLSIGSVEFFIDNSTTPALTQEVADVNTSFERTRQWLYHAALSTSSLGSGTHSIKAVATDVSGAQKSVSQTFTINHQSR